MPRIAALMLAAGNSQRFGSDKRLARHQDTGPTLLQQSINLPLQLKLETLLVLRQGDQVIQSLLHQHHKNPLLTLLYSTNAAQGMGCSLADGIKQLQHNEDYDGVLIMLGDMPWIKPPTIEKLLANFHPNRIIAPRLQQPHRQTDQGHPVLFPRQYFKDLQILQGDRGAKSVLEQYPDQLTLITVDDLGITEDIDRPEDFSRYPLLEKQTKK